MHSQETYLFIKVIIMPVNIKHLVLLACFHVSVSSYMPNIKVIGRIVSDKIFSWFSLYKPM